MKSSFIHPVKLGKTLLMLSLAALLAACGFHLRGAAQMPFKSIYIEAVNPNSPLISELRSNLKANHIELPAKADQAEVILNIAQEQTDKQILSLGGNGRVSEYQLHYRVSLRAYDNQQNEWLSAENLKQSRDFTYDDTQLLAKATEEEQLYQNMRVEMAQQIMRRLSHAKPEKALQK